MLHEIKPSWDYSVVSGRCWSNFKATGCSLWCCWTGLCGAESLSDILLSLLQRHNWGSLTSLSPWNSQGLVSLERGSWEFSHLHLVWLVFTFTSKVEPDPLEHVMQLHQQLALGRSHPTQSLAGVELKKKHYSLIDPKQKQKSFSQWGLAEFGCD